MTRIDELNIEINELKDKANSLKLENKIDEALEIVNDIKAKKSEIEKLETLENELKEGVKVENKLVENKELLNKEEKIFLNLVRSGITDDMKAGDNGAIIPNTISSRIIEKVEEISPIFARATKFNIGGDLTFTLQNGTPTCVYMEEMGKITSTDATFKTVKLSAFIASTLTKVSRSFINRTDFDLLNYVVNAVAKSIANFLEKELISGTPDKVEGLSKVVTTEVSDIKADSYIDLQMEVPTALQGGCEWLMNPSDLKSARKFKTTDGQYLLNADPTKEFGWSLLGKGILISDQVAVNTVYYGDFSGLYVKLANDVEVSVLKEKYADEYAVGVLGFVEFDAKVVETQKIVAMKKTA